MTKYRVTKQDSEFGMFWSYDEAYVAILMDARDCGVPIREYGIFTVGNWR